MAVSGNRCPLAAGQSERTVKAQLGRNLYAIFMRAAPILRLRYGMRLKSLSKSNGDKAQIPAAGASSGFEWKTMRIRSFGFALLGVWAVTFHALTRMLALPPADQSPALMAVAGFVGILSAMAGMIFLIVGPALLPHRKS